jgi:hypothetical protein
MWPMARAVGKEVSQKLLMKSARGAGGIMWPTAQAVGKEVSQKFASEVSPRSGRNNVAHGASRG